MTRIAKLDAPTNSPDGPALAPRAASADRRGRPAAESVSPQAIDNEMMAELESALQAVLARGLRLEAPQTVEGEAAAPATDPVLPDEAPSAIQPETGFGAAEPSPPPYLLQPAAEQRPARIPAGELAPLAAGHPPAAAPHRRALTLRAGLCVAGVLGLAGVGGAGLMLAAAPEDRQAPLLAKPVRTEMIHAPVAADPQPARAEREASEAEAARTAVAETPASEVTLLRPVGERRSMAAAVQPAERSPLVQVQPQTDAAASEAVKAPDRLVEPQAQEVASGDGGEAAAESRIPMVSPAAQPQEGLAERLSGWAEPDAGEETATAATPLAEEALVAETVAEGEDPAAGAAGAAQPEMRQEPVPSAAPGVQGPAQAGAASGEGAARTAPVTSAVNMRAGPDNDATVLTVIPAGSDVQVISCEHWCEVVFAGERGWVYKSFVRGADS